MFGSYFFSFLLHIGLAVVIFLWPSPPPLQLEQPMMQISVNMGAPGGQRMASPVLGAQGKPSPTKATTKPAPAEDAKAAVPVAREDTVQPKKAEQKQEPKPKPEPKPDAVALAQKKEKPRPKKDEEDDKKDDKKDKKNDTKESKDPKNDKDKKDDDKRKEDANAKEAKASDKKKDGVDPKDALADALADAQKKAGPQGTKDKGGKSSVAGALADFEKNSKGSGHGGGGAGEGDGPGGGGIYDVYMGQVILAVRPNWSMPTYSRQNLSVQVRVKLDASGKVLDCSVARSSGRAEVDASAVNAIIRTKVLPPPPTPEQQDLLMTFNTQEMGRR